MKKRTASGYSLPKHLVDSLFMPNLASLLKEEIVRLARRELKGHLDPVKKAVAGYRRDIAALKRQVGALERGRSALEKQLLRKSASSPAAVGEPADEKPLRFSAKGLKTLRARLGISAEQFGLLVGVSGQSVYNWEKGTAPRRDQVRAIAALRGLGKREVQARLAERK
jgi:DNA-binding transcriptional regulator YiaG